jgi:formyltetrahydrofolate-dependent phosphoribosylglycinamide formyltransferase
MRNPDVQRIVVLASGGGSNLQAILQHFDALGADAPARVVLVASDRADALALERARRRDITTADLPRTAPESAIERLLGDVDADLIVLAGYLRLVPASVVRRWNGRMLNIHPALLPAFGGHGLYGHRVHEAVIAAGARISGATVHFVNEQFDRGAIIAQWPVPVPDGDTPDALAERVLRVEHRLYPWCIDAVARGLVRLGDDGRAHGALPYNFPRFGVEGPLHPFVPEE